MTLRDCDRGRYAAPVHVEAEFRGSVQARGRRVRGRVHFAAQFAGSRAFLPHVCRREACPVHSCPQFTGPPRTGGRRVPRGRPPGTRPTRVSCGRANSAQECTGTGHRPHSRGPSLRRPCKLAAGVYRRPSPAYSSGLSLRTRCKLGAGVYPGLRPPPHAPGSSLRNRANWGRVRTRGAGALARTRHDLARSCKLAADVCRQPAWHEAPAARYPSTAGATPVARISSRAASSSTGTPSCCAFVSFEPAASPATT